MYGRLIIILRKSHLACPCIVRFGDAPSFNDARGAQTYHWPVFQAVRHSRLLKLPSARSSLRAHAGVALYRSCRTPVKGMRRCPESSSRFGRRLCPWAASLPASTIYEIFFTISENSLSVNALIVVVVTLPFDAMERATAEATSSLGPSVTATTSYSPIVT